MKKIILIFISGVISLAVIAQDNQTKTTRTQKTVKQKSEAKTKTAILDGKTFKIALTRKDEANAATSAKDETAITKEPVEKPEMNRSASNAYADWSNAKAN